MDPESNTEAPDLLNSSTGTVVIPSPVPALTMAELKAIVNQLPKERAESYTCPIPLCSASFSNKRGLKRQLFGIGGPATCLFLRAVSGASPSPAGAILAPVAGPSLLVVPTRKRQAPVPPAACSPKRARSSLIPATKLKLSQYPGPSGTEPLQDGVEE